MFFLTELERDPTESMQDFILYEKSIGMVNCNGESNKLELASIWD